MKAKSATLCAAIGTVGILPIAFDTHLDTNEVSARINYHFNTGGGGLYGSY